MFYVIGYLLLHCCDFKVLEATYMTIHERLEKIIMARTYKETLGNNKKYEAIRQ